MRILLALGALLLATSACGDEPAEVGADATTTSTPPATSPSTSTSTPSTSTSSTSTSTSTTATTSTTAPPEPTTVPTTEPPTTVPERNLSRNGPFEPQGALWPRDGDMPGDEIATMWAQGIDTDGWVVRLELDWTDGSPVEVYEWGLEQCAADDYPSGNPEDPFPSTNAGNQYAAVQHTWAGGPGVERTYLLTVTSVSCDGDEPQVATTELHGG